MHTASDESSRRPSGCLPLAACRTSAVQLLLILVPGPYRHLVSRPERTPPDPTSAGAMVPLTKHPPPDPGPPSHPPSPQVLARKQQAEQAGEATGRDLEEARQAVSAP